MKSLYKIQGIQNPMENDAEQTTERKVKIDSCDNRKKEMQCSFEDSFYLTSPSEFQHLPVIPTLIVPLQLNISISASQKLPLETQTVQKLLSHIYLMVSFFKALKVRLVTGHL